MIASSNKIKNNTMTNTKEFIENFQHHSLVHLGRVISCHNVIV